MSVLHAPVYRAPWRAALARLSGVMECESGYRWRPKKHGANALVVIQGTGAYGVVGFVQTDFYHFTDAVQLLRELGRLLDKAHNTASTTAKRLGYYERMVLNRKADADA